MADSSTIVLHDLRKGSPDERSFLTLQVFVCDICHALTNVAHAPFKYVPRVHATCPHHEEESHRKIRAQIEWLHEQPHPKEYHKALKQEIAKMKRKARKKARNLLVGNPDLAQRRPVLQTGGSFRISTASTFTL